MSMMRVFSEQSAGQLSQSVFTEVVNEIAEKCFIKQLNIGDTPLQILWNVGDNEGQLQALSAYFSNAKVQQL